MLARVRVFDAAVVVLGAALLGSSLLLPDVHYGLATLSFWLEASCAVMALAVVSVGFRGYLDGGSTRLLFMGLGFLVFAVMEVLYGFSAPGGYSFLVREDAGVALWLWTGMRLAGSTFLLLSVLLAEADRRPGNPRTLALWLLGTLAILAAFGALANSAHGWLPSLWNETGGVTPLKVELEWLGVALQLVVALGYRQRFQRYRFDVLLAFSLGMVASAMAGIAMTGHHTFYDLGYWQGQTYKLVGYLSFLLGVWLLRRPQTVSS